MTRAMADVDLNDLAVFVRVVDRGGFARVAREMGVPTSTVSRTVARLESTTGTRLLHRTTRSVTPTSDGRELYASVAGAVATLQATARTLEPATRKPKGRLRLTAPNDLGVTFLPPLLVEFTERYPLVQVDLELTNRAVNLVDEGFDLALRASGRLPDSSLVAKRLGDLAAFLYASPAYLKKHGTPKTAAQLAEHRIVTFRGKELAATWELTGADGILDVPVKGRLGGDDFGFVRAALVAGAGIGLVPQIVCAADEAAGQLVRVLPELSLRNASLYVVYPSAHNVPARVTAFRDFVAEAFADRIARCVAAEAAEKRRTPR